MRRGHRYSLVCISFVFGLIVTRPLASQKGTDVTNEWRITAFPHYPIKGNLIGFGYLGWVKNPGADYSLWYAGAPGLIYNLKPWIQLWGGLLDIYTNNYTNVTGKQDSLELRPFIGAKIFVPNKFRWNIYNFSRLEFRQTYSHSTHDWTNVERLRMRFGIEAPLTSRENAWKLNTFYGIANVEPLVRFDRATWIPSVHSSASDTSRIPISGLSSCITRIGAEWLRRMTWISPKT